MQTAVSVHGVTDAASCPLDWRLFLPESWDDTYAETNELGTQINQRRHRAGIPDTGRHRPKRELALKMLDELASWGHRPPAVVADDGYGEVSPFRTNLTERGIAYVVAVKAATSVHPAHAPPTGWPNTPSAAGQRHPDT